MAVARFGNRKESKQLWKAHELERKAEKCSSRRSGDPIKALLLEWTPAVFWLSRILLKVDIPGRKHLISQSQVTWPPPGHQQKDLAQGVSWDPNGLCSAKISTWVHHPIKIISREEEINFQNDIWVLLWRWNKYGVVNMPNNCPLSLLYCEDNLSCDSTVWFKNADVYIIGLIWSSRGPQENKRGIRFLLPQAKKLGGWSAVQHLFTSS